LVLLFQSLLNLRNIHAVNGWFTLVKFDCETVGNSDRKINLSKNCCLTPLRFTDGVYVQETLTEVEGSVQLTSFVLTSLDQLLLKSHTRFTFFI
jgi:hypothetical protein